MPEFESRKPIYTKTRKKKKENFFLAMMKSVFPCKGDSRSDVIRKIIFFVSVVVLIYAVISIIYFYMVRDLENDLERQRFKEQKELNHTDDVISISIKQDKGSDEESTATVLEEYVSFYNENSDFIGWLEIDPYITYPVVQTTDNDYYLKHNFNKQATENGTPFADYEGIINSTEMPNNVIIYGHNLLTKNAFQPLSYYRSKGIDFLKENYLINFDTLYNRGQYLIFAVFLVNTKEEHGEVFDYQNNVYFKDKADFDSFVGECLDRSYYYTGIDVTYGDQLLTLSTCDFSMFSDMRLVVVARKLRNDEEPMLDTSTFIDNTGYDADGNVKRKMFDAYYETYSCQWAGRNWDSSYLK